MKAKDYMMQIRRMDDRIKALELSAKSALDRATGTTTDYDKLPIDRSHVNPRLEENYAELMERIRWEKSELMRVQEDVTATISKIKRNEYATLLLNYYVLGWTFEQCAVNMHFSYRHIVRIHGEALMEVQRIIDSETCP
jgi:hypothetical protein